MNSLKNTHIFPLLTSMGLLVLSSCDPGSKIKYSVANKTSRPIVLKYKFSDFDTVKLVLLAPDSSKIMKAANELDYVDGIDERKDSIFFSILTIKQNQKASNKNFRDRKYWKLKTENHLNATYWLMINQSFFDNN